MRQRPDIGQTWQAHADYLFEHPPDPGTPLDRDGCTGFLVVDTHLRVRAFTVRCDTCWAAFAVGPPVMPTADVTG